MSEDSTRGELTCQTKHGGIKAIIISPWSGKSDSQILDEMDIFLKVGDCMTKKDDSVMFGKDIKYIKISD